MTTQTWTPAQLALRRLGDHSIGCPKCRLHRECAKSTRRYRVWWNLFNEERRR